MKIKEKIQNGWSKVKETVKTHKSKIIKIGTIVGGTALGLGALALTFGHKEELTPEYFREFAEKRGLEPDDSVNIYEDEDGRLIIEPVETDIEIETEETVVEEAE